MTYAAGSGVGSTPPVSTVAAAPTPPLVVPDVRNQAFVFAKGTLAESGFAWQVTGSVHGYAANVVVSQSPEAGSRVVADGSPLVTLTLRRNGNYPEAGDAADTSPYPGTTPQPADLAGNPLGPAAPATTTPAASTAPSATPKAATPAAKVATPPATPATSAKPAAKPAATFPQSRPVAFVVPGARKEPLDELPLPDRATALRTWLDTHTSPTAAAQKYWLYQNAWVVAGAEFGWWRGAEALKTLIAVDKRAQQVWGVGAKSASAAAQALRVVEAKAKR